MKKSNVKKMCFAAVMAALYVGLDFLAVSLSAPFGGTLKISISGLPVIITAAFFGPVWAAAAGFVGALTGQLITYGFGATTLLWVLPAVVRGLSFGLFFKLTKNSLSRWILSIEIIISSLLVTAFNSLAMWLDALYFQYPVAIFGISLVNRIIAAVLTAIVFAVVLPTILKALKRLNL